MLPRRPYEKNKPEMEEGLKGVKLAHSSLVGAGSGIIGMVESNADFFLA